MPSQSLEGLTTESGWTITKLLRDKLGSGGNFCTRYLARSENGEEGFLKAMDVSGVVHDISLLQSTVNVYMFEQNILNKCKDKKMSKVVVPQDAGEITVPNFAPPLNTVYYVIFEKAEGTLRDQHLEVPEQNWLAVFRALHHVALGIEQLHNAEMAHQDIKPSNVLAFSQEQFKVSDLGRVVDRQGISPFSSTHFPGDPAYKPIEMYFGLHSLDFNIRKSCDMNMVGSLVFHVVENMPLNALVLREARLLDTNLMAKPFNEALPYILSAFNTVLRRFEDHCIDLFGEKVATSIVSIVYEMCHPDPSKRGLARATNQNVQYSMRRYVGKLANLVRYAKIHGVV
jgi:eukaryotic-like serine/threonine-protein kinase